MDSVSPVWTEEDVEFERVIALDQEQYTPIIALPFEFNDGTQGWAVRFVLSDSERDAIAKGCDLVVSQLTFGSPFVPIRIDVKRKSERQFE